MRLRSILSGQLLAFLLATVGCAKAPATISTPEVFEVAGPEVEVAALVQQAKAEDRLLLVWAVGPERGAYPSEFDEDPLKTWVRDHAIAIRVPGREAPVLRPISASGSALVVYRDGHAVADLRRTLDATATTRILTGLNQGKPLGEVVSTEAKRDIAEPEDVLRRHDYAGLMIDNGDLEMAEEALRWLYVHGEEHHPHFHTIRGSFLLLTISELSAQAPDSVERFELLMTPRDVRRYRVQRLAFAR